MTEETLSCLICGRDGFVNLIGHVYNAHGLNSEEYNLQTGYTGPFITNKQARKMGAISTLSTERRSEIAKSSYNQELREKRSSAALQQWADPDQREKKISSIIDKANDPIRIENLKKGLKEHFENKPKSPDSELRFQLYKRADSRCEVCGISEKELGKRLHLHHLSYDKIIPDLEDVMLLCGSCHRSFHNVNSTTREQKVRRVVGELLRVLGVDLEDENFSETPRRLSTYLIENFLEGDEIEYRLEEHSSAIFPNLYDGMVVMKDTPIVGLCPHHLLPVFYKVTIGYIPMQNAIGISKLHRIAELLAKRPLMQETYTVLLADYFSDLLKAEDVSIRVKGTHTCMSIRGVKVPDSEVVTSELRGSFLKDASIRNEFLLLAGLL